MNVYSAPQAYFAFTALNIELCLFADHDRKHHQSKKSWEIVEIVIGNDTIKVDTVAKLMRTVKLKLQLPGDIKCLCGAKCSRRRFMTKMTQFNKVMSDYVKLAPL